VVPVAGISNPAVIPGTFVFFFTVPTHKAYFTRPPTVLFLCPEGHLGIQCLIQTQTVRLLVVPDTSFPPHMWAPPRLAALARGPPIIFSGSGVVGNDEATCTVTARPLVRVSE